MYHDVRRRLPYYWSDIRDAFTYRTIASIIRMYFVKYVKCTVHLFPQGLLLTSLDRLAFFRLSRTHSTCTGGPVISSE